MKASHLSLRPVTVRNRGDLDGIDPGDPQRYWVHSNWYWHQQSLDNPNIIFRLIHADGEDSAIGMVAYGPAYEDRALTRAIPHAYEIIHLVLDSRHQQRGYGRVVADSVLRSLLALPDCERVLVATNPDNVASARFFSSLGFTRIERHNYDGDSMSEFTGRGDLKVGGKDVES